MPQLSTLIYCSRVSPDLHIGGVYDILEQSSRYNTEHDITGMMLFNSRYFLQAIEGQYSAIVDLSKKIQLDARHRHFAMLGHQRVVLRTWANWSMNLVTPNPANRSIFEEYDTPDGFDPYRLRFNQAHAMLLKLAKQTLMPASS